MQDLNQERVAYQQKYGNMKDYISSTKIDVKKKMVGEEVFVFNNKQLIQYLEDKYQDSDKSQKLKEIKENVIIRSHFMIQAGFNVCLHGFGSKKQVIKEISDIYTDVPRLIVQGYSPASQIQQILQKLQYIVVKVTGINPSAGQKRSEGITEYLKQSEKAMGMVTQIPFILIAFHNLDARQFIDNDQMRLISKIFSLSYIRTVCSIDHVKYSTAITPKILEKFNFSFIEFHSHDCYINEFKVGQNTFTIKKEKEGEALKYILRSLTKVQKQIIQFVAKYIKDKLDENPGASIQSNGQTEAGSIIGLTLKELLELLIEEMILNSEQQLKENLLEILDHKVIISLESQQKTFYTMNYSRVILDKIINNKLEEEEEEEAEEQDERNEDDMQDEGAQNNSSYNSNSQSEDDNNQKGGKRKQKNKISSQSSKSNSENESNSEDEKPQQPKKRRGRPPSKNKLEKNKKISYVSETSEEDVEDD